MPATTPSQTVGPYFTLGLFASQAYELVEPTNSADTPLFRRRMSSSSAPVPEPSG